MKALIYKEFKLALHPVCIIFILLFPFMILIPNYPLAIGFIYILAAYPILFLGANKGQQSNDLLYSVLQPVRKKDVVLARLITVLTMQVTTIIIMSIIYPLARLVNQNVINQAIAMGQPAPTIPGLGLDSFVSIIAFGVISFAIADLIYFPIYYRKGRSIVASTIITIFVFAILICGFTMLLPLCFEGYMNLFGKCSVGIQFIYLGIAVILSAILHYFTYKLASKELEKVDF